MKLFMIFKEIMTKMFYDSTEYSLLCIKITNLSSSFKHI